MMKMTVANTIYVTYDHIGDEEVASNNKKSEHHNRRPHKKTKD